MKILITETQFDKIIDRYITMIFSPYKVITNSTGSFFLKNGVIVAQLSLEDNVFIDFDIWNNIKRFISTLNIDMANIYVRLWISKHLNLNPKYIESLYILADYEQQRWRAYEKYM
jgi:hypothetical protein